MNYIIQLANQVVTLHVTHKSTWNYCEQFAIKTKSDFSVTVTPEDIALEREQAQREDALEGLPAREYTDQQLEITALLRKITERLFDYDTLLFHGSVVAVDGAAYLFTAKSGTGKSTHTRLWRELLGDRAVMVNDDKPFLRITPEGVVACGSPWNGKHGLGNNIQVPLKAICVLERGRENRIRQISSREALFTLLQQSSRPGRSENMPKYLELIDRLAQGVKLYKMDCTISPEAARLAFETMSKD